MIRERLSVWFEAPREVSVRREPLEPLAADEVLVATHLSAISAGTELLFYRGHVPDDMATDASLAALNATDGRDSRYPLRYGYAAVGRVVATGAAVDALWSGQRVFAFQPHSSHFAAHPNDLVALPNSVSDEQATLLPNMETAVNLLLDGRPLIGERVIVLGLGIVGLLTTALLARLPLAHLVAIDPIAARREQALALGAHEAFAPGAADLKEVNADLIYELSGNPAALADAICGAGFGSRIIVGSWYGTKQAPLPLGADFHRNRVAITSSQVSTIASPLGDRWSKPRRLSVALNNLSAVDSTISAAHINAARLITHTFPVVDAAQAYALLDAGDENAVGVLLRYSGAADQ